MGDSGKGKKGLDEYKRVKGKGRQIMGKLYLMYSQWTVSCGFSVAEIMTSADTKRLNGK